MTGGARRQLQDLAAMSAFGAAIAPLLKAGDVIALEGGLGAGKTTLARAIIAALGYTGEVPSPTFTIIETYDTPAMRLPIVHADFYRLKSPQEALELGLEDYREEGAMIVEWPDHAGGFTHEAGCLTIRLENAPKGEDDGRIAIVEPGADWLERTP